MSSPVEVTGILSMENAQVQAFRSMAEPITGGPRITAEPLSKYRWTRHGKPVDDFIDVDELPKIRFGEMSYFGPLLLHFGHLMAENLHRFVTAPPEMKRGRWLFVGLLNGTNRTLSDLPQWYRDILTYIGLFPDQICITVEDCVVDCLHLIPQQVQLGVTPTEDYLSALHELSLQKFFGGFEASAKTQKLYVSRSALTGQGNILGESYIEQQLLTEGYTVIRPEIMSFREQVLAYLKSSVIIFPEGSAIHGAELLGHQLGTVGVICRRPNSKYSFETTLRCRAESVYFLENVLEVGTATRHPFNGRLLEERSQVFIHGSVVVSFFKNYGFADLQRFDHKQYVERVQLDLHKYVAVARQHSDVRIRSESELETLFNNLQRYVRTE